VISPIGPVIFLVLDVVFFIVCFDLFKESRCQMDIHVRYILGHTLSIVKSHALLSIVKYLFAMIIVLVVMTQEH
jgi:hypothetical protein